MRNAPRKTHSQALWDPFEPVISDYDTYPHKKHVKQLRIVQADGAILGGIIYQRNWLKAKRLVREFIIAMTASE